MKQYFRNILIAFDQFLGAWWPGSFPDETFSARCWREREKPFWGRMRRLVDRLFWWDQNHCKGSFDNEIRRTQAPPETRIPPPVM